ncbi:MAG: hypothetical protein RR415_04590, partial [Ruthenibacterium sp.]
LSDVVILSEAKNLLLPQYTVILSEAKNPSLPQYTVILSAAKNPSLPQQAAPQKPFRPSSTRQNALKRIFLSLVFANCAGLSPICL